MKHLTRRAKQSKGIAIVLTTLTLAITLPLIGLGFDVGTLYLIKAKLSAAADSAALAGARALSQGNNTATQASNAVSAAENFFGGNFPTGYWNSTGVSSSVSVDSTSTPNYRTVTVTASVQAPLYFLRVFNQQYSTLNVSSQAGRRDVMMMLVLDRSNSMNQIVSGLGLSACTVMRADAAQFIGYFAPGRDQIGLVVFSGSTYYYPPTTSFTTPDASGNTIPSLIASISCEGSTSTAEALNIAYQQIKAVGSTTRANIVMLMTDGLPTGVTANYWSLRSNKSCGTSPLIGVFAGGTVGGLMFPGGSLGLSVDTESTLGSPDDVPIPNDAGCYFATNEGLVSKDIGSLPTADLYGNSTQGYTAVSPAYSYQPANLSDVTDAQGAVYAAINTSDNQATAIRSDTTLKPTIYTIGLSGDGAVDQYPDPLLLMKMANDPNLQGQAAPGPAFYTEQAGQPRGAFANAPDASQLAEAFDTIARQIAIRLSQ
ncbi:MAG: vWA domain-containing protein [Bryobacteraceae bacterium]|jgi:Flp pilus assembly protein TadG